MRLNILKTAISKMKNSRLFKYIRENRALGGPLILAILAFVQGLLHNLSISYMGNSSKAVEELLFGNFVGNILTFLLSVLLLYIAIGLLLGMFWHYNWRLYYKLRGKRLTVRRHLWLNIAGVTVSWLLLFLRDLINYPQVYMNNFYVRNSFNRWFTDTLTGNVTPALFTLILIFIIIAAAAQYLYWRWSRTGFSLVRLRRISAVGLVLVGFILFTRMSFFNSSNSQPNVLILASDALRPDHLSASGYKYPTSPNIDRIIGEGVFMENACGEVPRTFPSWVSILTGQYTATHGIRHMFPSTAETSAEFRTIVKKLNEKGYYTAVVGDYAADIFTRINLGFQKVKTPYFNFNTVMEQSIIGDHFFLQPFLTNRIGLKLFPALADSAYFCPPELVTEKIKRTINRRGKRPFMLTAFYSATHFPYAPPYPYYQKFADPSYRGAYKYYKQPTISIDNALSQKLTREDIAQIHALYDGGINAFDHEVGEIVDYLKSEGIYDNTIIILLADHGENLYEGDAGMGHGEHLKGTRAIRFPLVIRYPQIIPQGKRYKELVRQVDVAPTIMEMLKIDVPDYVDGKSFLSLYKTGTMDKRYAYGETGIWFEAEKRPELFFQYQRIRYPDVTGISSVDFAADNQIVLSEQYRDLINIAKHRYIYDGRYKLIYMPTRSGVEYAMYNTATDPQEERNIYSSEPAVANTLKTELTSWMLRSGKYYQQNGFILPKEEEGERK